MRLVILLFLGTGALSVEEIYTVFWLRYMARRFMMRWHMAILSRVTVVVLLFCFFSPMSRSQEAPSEKKEDTSRTMHHYVRAKDPKWYAKQLVQLRQELEGIDQQIGVMGQARKDGGGTTGAVALDKEPEGVSAEAELILLQQRRSELLRQISEIEDEARHNDVAPGAVRAEEKIEESGTSNDSNENEEASKNPEIAETENALREEKEHLERVRNEADLLQRKLDLDKRTVYSNPEYTVRQSGKAKLAATQNQIAEKQEEILQTKQKIADLEERLQDLKLNFTENGVANDPDSAVKVKVEEKGEDYWRKRFAELHYKIRMAQSELDILQRELNVSLLQYDPNPQKAMRENVTRRDINNHRQAIEDKNKEISELRQTLSDLEDELRHAGGNPGWSRE
jgi:chromosome segregation ATPase